MAALDNTKFVPFTLPPSNRPLYHNNTFEPLKTYPSIRLLKTSDSQNISRPTTTSFQSGCRAEVYRNTTARAEGCKPASASNHNKTDDGLLSFEKHFQTAPPLNISIQASKAEQNLQRLNRSAFNAAKSLVNSTRSELDKRQVNNLDHPIILDEEEANEIDIEDKDEDALGDFDTRRTEKDTSPHNTSTTLELASAPTNSFDISVPYDGVKESCHIDEFALRLGSCEQYSVPSVPAQAEPQTLLQSSKLLQDQTDKQDMNDITQGMSVGSAVHSLPKPSDNSDDGWNGDSMAELEKELGLALEEPRVEPSWASKSTPVIPRSVGTSQDEIQSRERNDTTGSRLEELQDPSRHNTYQGSEEWEQLETEVMGETGGVAMQQQEELAARKNQLGQPAVVDQQDSVAVGADDPEDKEVIEALPATPSEIFKNDEHRFRLRGIRTRLPAGGQKGTTQYRVVWGEHANRSDFWVNEDDLQISMLRQSYERSFQNLDLPVDGDVVRVRRMRCKRSGNGKKIFEYLVDHSRWITEERVRISLSRMLIAELKAPSPHQGRDDILRHSPVSFEHRYASRASEIPSVPIDLALSSELERGEKRQHQDTIKEISNNVHNSEDSDRSHETSNEDIEDDEDPRPAKRRKLPPTPIDNTLTPPDEPKLIDNDHHSSSRTSRSPYPSRASRSPSATVESALAAEYQEWPF